MISILFLNERFLIYLVYVHTFGYDVYIWYTTDVPAMVPDVTVDNSTINITGSNVALALSWGEPFNNLDPIVSYTVSYFGNGTCPLQLTTTDNTTRSYIITNLTTRINYNFSVVATNLVGSGKSGTLDRIFKGEVTILRMYMRICLL